GDAVIEARDRQILAEVREPVLEILPGDLDAVAFAHPIGCRVERVEAVVLIDRRDDDLQGEALSLRDERREFLIATAAIEELDGTVFVLADPLLDDAEVATVWAAQTGRVSCFNLASAGWRAGGG